MRHACRPLTVVSPATLYVVTELDVILSVPTFGCSTTVSAQLVPAASERLGSNGRKRLSAVAVAPSFPSFVPADGTSVYTCPRDDIVPANFAPCSTAMSGGGASSVDEMRIESTVIAIVSVSPECGATSSAIH